MGFKLPYRQIYSHPYLSVTAYNLSITTLGYMMR
jgi:hypothetical protein